MNLFTSRRALAAMILLNASCIHTTSYESKPVLSASENQSFNKVLRSGAAEVRSQIYSPEKYPLEDFFTQMARGEFKSAFKKARLSYKPSSSNNEILSSLLSSGFVPVLVKIKNISPARLDVSYSDFFLTGNDGSFPSMNPDRLPSHIHQFSPGAVAANVYNVTVVAALSLMMVLLLVRSNGNGNIPDFFNDSGYDNDKVLNPTDKATHIDYEKYVIQKKSLAPGEEVTGLVFFSLESMHDTEGLTLQYSAASK